MRTMLRVSLVLAAAIVGTLVGVVAVALFIRATVHCAPGDVCDAPFYVFFGLSIGVAPRGGAVAAWLVVWRVPPPTPTPPAI
jgi:hypothetical protein